MCFGWVCFLYVVLFWFGVCVFCFASFVLIWSVCVFWLGLLSVRCFVLVWCVCVFCFASFVLIWSVCVFWLGLLSVRRFVLFGAGWSVCVLCVVCLVVFCFLCYGLVWFLCLALVGSGLVWGVGRPSAKETLFSSMASEKISINYCYNMLLANQTNTKNPSESRTSTKTTPECPK